MRVVLTGAKGVGKSTVVRQVLRLCSWPCPAGFLTRRVELQPGQWAVEIQTWDGSARSIFARPSTSAPQGELPFALDAAACEAFAHDHLTDIAADRPVVLDELGIIEWGSPRFVRAIAALFDRTAPLLVVIQDRALERWLKLIGEARVDHLERVDIAGRATLADSVARWVSRRVRA